MGKDSERVSVKEAAAILGVYPPAIYEHMRAKGEYHWDLGIYVPPKTKGGNAQYIIFRRKLNKLIGAE